MLVTINRTVTENVSVKYLQVESHIRYVEDGYVNGEPDIEFWEQEEGNEARMPFVEKRYETEETLWGPKQLYNYYWCPLINVDEGRIMFWPEGKTAVIHYKTCDENVVKLLTDNKGSKPVFHYEGYVPSILDTKGDGYGDYIIMTVDEEGYIEGFDSDKLKKILG